MKHSHLAREGHDPTADHGAQGQDHNGDDAQRPHSPREETNTVWDVVEIKYNSDNYTPDDALSPQLLRGAGTRSCSKSKRVEEPHSTVSDDEFDFEYDYDYERKSERLWEASVLLFPPSSLDDNFPFPISKDKLKMSEPRQDECQAVLPHFDLVFSSVICEEFTPFPAGTRTTDEGLCREDNFLVSSGEVGHQTDEDELSHLNNMCGGCTAFACGQPFTPVSRSFATTVIPPLLENDLCFFAEETTPVAKPRRQQIFLPTLVPEKKK
ncbi:unnamed protein product [Amoebophrya sp. A120]|nr:unnamed protein product [Amoebophrya sp. A120]|eukprot:GSA120T00018278001.1